MLVPHAFAKRSTCGKRVIGRIPGTIGACTPAAARASRKRRNASVSKKNWVMARVAPASILRFRFSRSAAAERENLKRSEEHTSELQSQSNLVCRLLLEKKKSTAILPTVYFTLPCLSYN